MFEDLKKHYRGRWNRWIERRLPRTHRIVLDQKRIFIFPSQPGLAFLVILAVMLLMGINYQNNLIFGFCFILFSLFVVTIFHTYANLSGLEITARSTAPVFAGEDACFQLQINAGKRQRPGLVAGWPATGTHESILSRKEEITLKMYYPAPARGVFQPPRLLLETFFPLGTMRAWTWLLMDWQCLVYPRPEPAPPPTSSSIKEGEPSSGHRLSGDDFAGFHTYRPGDSLRHAYWRSYAKGQDLLVKDFSQPQSRDLWLNWDSFPGVPTERRLSMLCFQALEANREALAFGLKLPGKFVAIDSGEQHLDSVLRALALYGQ